jgi:hypothetical protein
MPVDRRLSFAVTVRRPSASTRKVTAMRGMPGRQRRDAAQLEVAELAAVLGEFAFALVDGQVDPVWLST